MQILYVQAVLVLLSVASLAWLTIAMRKAEQSKMLKRIAAVLHFVYELLFMIFYVTLFVSWTHCSIRRCSLHALLALRVPGCICR